MALPKANRLKSKKDIDRVFKKGTAVKGNFLFLKIVENDKDISRFGFIVSSKIINTAVGRNRIRRIFSEIAAESLDKGLDIVAVINKKGEEKYLRTEFRDLLSKI